MPNKCEHCGYDHTPNPHFCIARMEERIETLESLGKKAGDEIRHLRECLREQAGDKVEIAALKATIEEQADWGKCREDYQEQITALNGPRCDNDIGDGIICNAELVDGGEGVGVFCPLCDLREIMHEQRGQITALTAENDKLKAEQEQVEKMLSH